MNNEYFKAPDVVWINNLDLSVMQESGFDRYCLIRKDGFSEADNYFTSFTLTTTAEANTRKAVREELEKVLVTVCARCGMDLNDGLDNSYNVFTHGDIADQINDILAQYQDPRPTEVI